jgi:hypothetical protein
MGEARRKEEKRRPVQGAFDVRIMAAGSDSGSILPGIAALVIDQAAVFLQFQHMALTTANIAASGRPSNQAKYHIS